MGQMAFPLAVWALVLAVGKNWGGVARVVAGLLATVVPSHEARLALAGLAVIPRPFRGGLDGVALGWGFLVAASAPLVQRNPQAWFALTGVGALLVGGVWPFTGSWLDPAEPWGRTVVRGALALVTVRDAFVRTPHLMELWAPWAVWGVGAGLLWAAGLVLSPLGQARALRLLWFFELHLILLVQVGTTHRVDPVPLFWATTLPVAISLLATRGAGRGIRGKVFGLVAAASFVGLPGVVGFVARFVSLGGLVATSPAGFGLFLAGMLVLPAFLRPLLDRLHGSRCAPVQAVVCAALSLGLVVLGVAPGLLWGRGPLWVFPFLLRRGLP